MNRVKDKLTGGSVSFGTMLQFGHPGVAEVLSDAGFEWIAADMEHSDIDLSAFGAFCRAVPAGGALPLARVRENDTLAIRQVLDMGAAGVIVPMVHTAEDARHAVMAARHPPLGVRGISFHRANGYGARFAGYMRDSDRDVLLLMMIESRSGVENVRAILDVDGVDGIFIGPYDLSGSLGVVGQLDHPSVRDAVASCLDACRNTGRAAGIHIAYPTKPLVDTYVSSGFTFIGLGMDSLLLGSAARAALEAAGSVRLSD